MNFDEFKKFKNDCETKELYLYFMCPTSYYSQDGIEYLRSEWDIAKREFILSFSSMPIYNLTKEKYDLAYSKKDKLGINNLHGEKFLNYVFTNIEIEKNAVINKLYNDLSSNKKSTEDEFIPIYFVPQYFYNDSKRMSKFDIIKQEILIEFPGLNLYNLTNAEYMNINQRLSSKYGNFIESFKLTIEQEKEYVLNIFAKRGSYKFKPSDNYYDTAENICITSLNVYRCLKYKPADYKLSSNTFNDNKSSKNNSYNQINKYNKFKNNNSFINNSYETNKNTNLNSTFEKSSNNLNNDDINHLLRLTSLYNMNQTSMSLENLDTFCLQLGMDSSRIDRIKSYIVSNPIVLNNQNSNFDNTNNSFDYIDNTISDYHNTDFDYNIEHEYCEYDNYFYNNDSNEYDYEDNYDEHENSFNDYEDNYDEHENSFNDYEDNYDEHENSFNDYEDDYDEHENNFNDYEDDYDEHENNFNDYEDDCDEHEDYFNIF